MLLVKEIKSDRSKKKKKKSVKKREENRQQLEIVRKKKNILNVYSGHKVGDQFITDFNLSDDPPLYNRSVYLEYITFKVYNIVEIYEQLRKERRKGDIIIIIITIIIIKKTKEALKMEETETVVQ